jgi:lipopolysaccharide export system permease protein
MTLKPTLQIYIGWRFLIGIAAAFAVLAVLIFMVDFVELLRRAGKYGETPLLKLVTIALLHLPSYVESLVGFAVLVGSISALLNLNRKSELVIMRAAGMSVWQFLTPGMLVASAIGLIELTAYNPMAAWALTKSAQMYIEAFGRDSTPSEFATGWLRQDGADGQSVINTRTATNHGLTLAGITVFTFDHSGHFSERIDATRADLQEGAWLLTNAWVSAFGREPEKYDHYLLSTYLTPERATAAFGDARTISSWELPDLIKDAEKAKVPSTQFKMQFEQLLTRPLLCVAMVLLAATVSLRSFRLGKISTLLITGMIGGFGFFLISEISRQIGAANLAPLWVAVWFPVFLVILICSSVLLHQEDG